MNILNLLIKEKRAVGVEIGDQVIRAAYFRPKKRFWLRIASGKSNPPEHELVLAEEPFAENTIVEGVVANSESLRNALKAIWTKKKLASYYAIVSIPENKIYSHIFPFPKTENASQLQEAIKLAIDFQLPINKSEAYIGSENAGDSNVINEVRISEIPKPVVDQYISALSGAGIKILALESNVASIARSIKLKLGQVALVVKRGSDSATIFVLKDGIVRFTRVIPLSVVTNDNFLLKEAENVKTYYESEKKASVDEFPMEIAEIRDEYLQYVESNGVSLAFQSKWLVAVGAAMRGEIKKGEDNRISLMPVGTSEAYAFLRTATFIAFVRNMIIVVSIFFSLAFLAAYFFIFSITKSTNLVGSSILVPPVSPEELKNEELIGRVNLLTQAGASILSASPDWSLLIDDINAHVITGIIITNFSATSVTEPISMQGIALDRDALNEFKKSLQSSTYLTAVDIPVTNLEQKGDIPFSASFRLKDPTMLYYK